MTNSTLSPHRSWHAGLALGAAALLLAALCLPLGMVGSAYAASSAQQKGEEYAQQDPGWQQAKNGSGSTQYYLDIEEPEPEPTSIDINTGNLPKTGDAEIVRVLLPIVALAGLAASMFVVALIPKQRDDEEEEDDM